jgi:acid phosphatase class B
MDYFNTIDGKVLKSLQDLVSYLEEVDDETFYYHKPHFYEWIKENFSPRLAEKIKNKDSKEDVINELKTYLIIKEINKALKDKLDKEYQKILAMPEEARKYNKEELNLIKKRMFLHLEDMIE